MVHSVAYILIWLKFIWYIYEALHSCNYFTGKL